MARKRRGFIGWEGVLLGGVALAGLYWFMSNKQGQGDAGSGIGGALSDAAQQLVGTGEQVLNGAERNVADALNTGAQAYSGLVGGTYGALVPASSPGHSTPAEAQAFSSTFNTFTAGGLQVTQPNAAGTAINLNPSLIQPAQGGTAASFTPAGVIVQGALTQAAINAGIGVASLTPQSGGGVATNFAALAANPQAKTDSAHPVAMSYVPSVPARAPLWTSLKG